MPREAENQPDGQRDARDAEANQQLGPGSIELEFGVPFAGVILPPEQWAKTALKRLPTSGRLDLVELFGRDAPRVLDIGCGNGRFLLASATRRPEVDHIGIDVLPMVIRYATRRANQRGLSNCRWAACDGQRFLRELCAPGQLNEIHVYHPQPFAQPGEANSRLFNHDFLWLVHQALAPAGRLFVQTDNAAYWKYLQTVLSAVMHWHEQVGTWPEDPQGRTRREIVALNKGLSIYRGWGQRRDELDAESFAEITSQLPAPDFNAVHTGNPRQWRRPGRQRR
jgi:tRNA (guanine-N7-)-methyltransferase